MSSRRQLALLLTLWLGVGTSTLHAQPAPDRPAKTKRAPQKLDAPPPMDPAPAAEAPPAADSGKAPAGEAPPPAAPALPEGHEPKLTVKVEPVSGVRTGELVKLQITADAVLGDDVTIADQSFAPFEVHKKNLRVEQPQGDRQRFVFDLELLAFEPGDKPIPAISLRVVTKDNFVGTVKTDARPFKVRGLLDNEPNAQPKLETKPVPVLEDNWIPVYILAGLLAAGLVALATVYISRYLRKRKARAVPPPPPRPPWEVAVEALAALRRRRQAMIEAGQGAQFVAELNHVIREYLGGRYNFDGLETTTDEMLAQLKAHGAGLGFTQEVGMFLGRCDLVKFAKVEPDADEVDLLFAKAQDLVQFSGPDESRGLTAPRPPASASDATTVVNTPPPAAARRPVTPVPPSPSGAPVPPPPSGAPLPPPPSRSAQPPAASSTPADPRTSAPPVSVPPRKSGPANRGPLS